MREFFAVYMARPDEAYAFFQFPNVARDGFQSFVEAFKVYFSSGFADARYDGTLRAWHVRGHKRTAYEDFARQMAVNLVWAGMGDWSQWKDHQKARNAGTARGHFTWGTQTGQQQKQGGGAGKGRQQGQGREPGRGGYENPLYKVLQCIPEAEAEVVKAAYRALAIKYHPDKNPGDNSAAQRMQQINDAWAALKPQLK